MLESSLFLVANGVSIGITLFIAASGLAILFGILKMLNFAHGSFIMVGAYLASTLLSAVPGYGIAAFLGIAAVAGILVGLAGLVVDRVIFRRLQGLDEAVALIATFALMLVVDGGVELIWGPHYISVDVPQGLDGAIFLGPLAIPSFSVLLLVVGVVLFLLVDLVLTRSWMGKTLQAVSDDRWIMDILGHNPRQLEILAVFFAFFLAGFAGAVLSPNQVLAPDLGRHMIIQAFAVVVVGGLGSIRGAFLAAMLLGIAESFGSTVMPSLSLYLGMIVILILRPQGLVARRISPRPGFWSWSWLWEGLGSAAKGREGATPAGVSGKSVPDAFHSAPASARPGGGSVAETACFILLFLALVSVPFWAGAGLVFVVGIGLISAVFSMSWNLMFGFAGVASFGHAAFFAIGAYLSAYALKYEPGVSFGFVLAGAFVLGGLVAVPVGILALRRATGVQLAILTLALAEVLRVLISYAPALGRDEGLSAVPRPSIGFGSWSIHLASDARYYFFLCAACGLMIWILRNVCRSSFGRTLRAIRQDAERSMFLGINVDRFRLQAFVLAAAIAAYVGALSAPLSQIVTPQVAGISRSTEPMLHTLLGGAGSFWGPALGTAIFSAIDYGTRTFAGLSEFIMGITLLLVVLVAPSGVAGLFRRLLRRLFSARSSGAASVPSPAVERL